ncbi:uncharacterized protein AMSG_12097 [Thecamonas trahens ATCC 50062]|uniref:Glutathione peroxidase n=1 Tax=Thecamonas trahens ATCC 50062 TaxID=461836 RepID=A0A0L0DH57_THETB|nr:hypothetical protein AMSG_12097 [Thecamonas trahens ATCC 50062]KNC51679.1 hypothetical protein AMSG_12097 [Thecamonas trahens ATCC 50062]|eukprot:XP_013755898.1 hypothetical protein AMSG_12097 [Thecamonas trahens ATCC 50062]
MLQQGTLAVLAVVVAMASAQAYNASCTPQTGDFFSYSSTDIHGNTYDFSQLKGKVVLAVNVASY